MLRLGHIGMTVSDLDRSRDFYRDLFGFGEFFRVRRTQLWIQAQVGYPNADLEFLHMRGPGGLHLELVKYWKPMTTAMLPDDTFFPGSTHINFWVEDVEAFAERFSDYIQRMEKPGIACFAAKPLDIEATTITEGPQTGGRGYYLRDPDGHTIEVWQPAKTAEAQGFGKSPASEARGAPQTGGLQE